MKSRSSVRVDPGLGSLGCIPCMLGEVQPPGSGQCHWCSPATFSIEAGEQRFVTEWNEDDSPDPELPWAMCEKCSIGAVCRGGYRLKAKNGYWRSSNLSTTFTPCFMPTACQGAARDFDAKIPELTIEKNESCAEGYTGRLCHACDNNWGRDSFDGCAVCPPKVANFVLTVFGVLTVILILSGFIVYSIQSSADESSTSSMMFKTLAAYGQVVGIASLFPYKWPREVLDLFELMDTVTSVSDRILNTDCALESRRGRGLPIVYEKAILYMLSPLVFSLCAFFAFALTHYCLNSASVLGRKLREKFLRQGERWTRKDTKRCLIVSVIVVMVILHPTLVRQSMFLLMCVNIEDSYYLRKDVQLQCGTVAHNAMVVFVAVPGILIYVFAWPYAVYLLLHRRKHKLHLSGIAGHDARATYGFLYRGYAPKRFYWEIIIMLRKTAMVMVATFGLRATVQTQGMIALLVLMLALTGHLIYQPYDEPILDRLEFFGLGAATVTLYFGMFFFTDDVVFAPWWGFVVTFTIMIVNSAFLMYFALVLYAAFREESNAIKRLSTICSLRCIACRERCVDRCGARVGSCCICISPTLEKSTGRWLARRTDSTQNMKLHNHVRDERDKFAADRRKNFDGFWIGNADGREAKVAAIKRQKERQKRIRLNLKIGRGKALKMAPTPLAYDFENRSSVIKHFRNTSELNAKQRKNLALERMYKINTPAPPAPAWPSAWDARPSLATDTTRGRMSRWSKILLAKRIGENWRKKSSKSQKREKEKSSLFAVSSSAMRAKRFAKKWQRKARSNQSTDQRRQHKDNTQQSPAMVMEMVRMGSAGESKRKESNWEDNSLYLDTDASQGRDLVSWVAFCDYEAAEEDEIDLAEGDEVEVVAVVGDGWTHGRNMRTGNTGAFPTSYITPTTTSGQDSVDSDEMEVGDAEAEEAAEEEEAEEEAAAGGLNTTSCKGENVSTWFSMSHQSIWVAISDYTADEIEGENAELNLRKGEKISVIVPDDGSGWVKARNASRMEGFVPASFLVDSPGGGHDQGDELSQGYNYVANPMCK